MKIYLFLILCFSHFSLFAQTSYVPFTKILGKKGHELGVTIDQWNTFDRFDESGKKIPWNEGESFSRIESQIGGAYGLASQFQIHSFLKLRQNQSQNMNTSTYVIDEQTSTGVESILIGATYGFKPVQRWSYILEGHFKYRPFINEETTALSQGSLILGDDGNEYSVGAGATYDFGAKNYLSFRGGYRSVGLDMASELYWQTEGALSWKVLALVAGAHGVFSNGDDPYGSDPLTRPLLNTGATRLYYGVNRDYIQPYVGVNFALGKWWRLEMKASEVVEATSYDKGRSYSVSLVRRVDQADKKLDRVFKNYDIEMSVSKLSPQKGYLEVDKGVSSDVQKGMKIDFYEFDYVGGNILLASGVVIQVKVESAIVKITHVYNSNKDLKEGIVGRASFR